MTLDKEDQVAVLYALHRCGSKGRKSRIISYIIQKEFLKQRDGDTDIRQTGETRIENDLAWARADLKKKKFLSMPEHGVWQITDFGREKLFGVAKAVYEDNAEDD